MHPKKPKLGGPIANQKLKLTVTKKEQTGGGPKGGQPGTAPEQTRITEKKNQQKQPGLAWSIRPPTPATVKVLNHFRVGPEMEKDKISLCKEKDMSCGLCLGGTNKKNPFLLVGGV